MMKRKQNILPFILIFIVIFTLMSLPKLFKEKLAGSAVLSLTPLWEKTISIKNYFSSKNNSKLNSLSLTSSEKLQKLELENQHLHQQIHTYQEILEHELILITQLSSFLKNEFPDLTDEAKQHQKEIYNLIKMQIKAIPAHVIFRAHSTWSSSIWINVGSQDNEKLNEMIIQKNSPIVLGKSLIGIIDYVGKKQSRVRLITDSGLCPSVRVCRGENQNRFLRENIQSLAGMISTKPGLFDHTSKKAKFLKDLEALRIKLQSDQKTWLLAKGELQGRSNPLWRSPGQTLKGIGFNYDYPDEEGPARDLRSGKPLNAPESIPTLPIIQENDLLITTGLDGVFPPGFPVAEVTKIQLLREGDYYYELEAKPTAGNLDDLFLVYVLPPVEFSSVDQPPLRGN